jgi:hypothetical protein
VLASGRFGKVGGRVGAYQKWSPRSCARKWSELAQPIDSAAASAQTVSVPTLSFQFLRYYVGKGKEVSVIVGTGLMTFLGYSRRMR